MLEPLFTGSYGGFHAGTSAVWVGKGVQATLILETTTTVVITSQTPSLLYWARVIYDLVVHQAVLYWYIYT